MRGLGHVMARAFKQPHRFSDMGGIRAMTWCGVVIGEAIANLLQEAREKGETMDLKEIFEKISGEKDRYFMPSICREVDLSGMKAIGYPFGKWNFQGSNLGDAVLNKGNFVEAELNKTSLKRASLQQTNFTKAKLREADLEEADLTGATLEEADLSNATLDKVILIGASCQEANFKKASLKNAKFAAANLSKADLREADLEDADLAGAVLDNMIIDAGTKITAQQIGQAKSYKNMRVSIGGTLTYAENILKKIEEEKITVTKEDIPMLKMLNELYPFERFSAVMESVRGADVGRAGGN